MNEYQEAELLNEIQRELMNKLFDVWAREKRLTQQKAAVVATGGAVNTAVTVYFPPDMVNASNSFINKTQRALSPGEKVYVLLKYGETDQGWIID